MNTPNLLPAAEQELREAIDWYESRRSGLGVEFLAVVDEALHAIWESPARHPVWEADRRFRRMLLRRYPHVIFFHVRSDGPEVVAVAHSGRRPGYWLRRLRATEEDEGSSPDYA